MTAFRRAGALLTRVIATPFRLYRRRTLAQLMVSHVAVVLITFLLLNALAVAVIVGWLPGRGLIGLEDATQDFFLGERARGQAVWLDVDEVLAEHGALDTPEARSELERRLAVIVANEVPGYQVESGGSPRFPMVAFGVPRAAFVTDAAGVVLATSDPAVAETEAAATDVPHTAASDAIRASLALGGEPDAWSGVNYTIRVHNDVTGAASPMFDASGGIAGYLVFLGFPLTQIFAEARSDIVRDTAISVLRTSWFYIIPAVLVALPFAYLQARGTSRRLEKLAHLADAFADGDLHTRVRVTRHDEVGRLADRFNEMGTRIETSDRERRAFLSNVSHELRTPVAIIQGTVERLQERRCRSQEEAIQAVELMNLETRNLSRLIDDLSTLGRLEEAKLRLELRPVSVHEVAGNAVGALKKLAWTQRKVTVENIVSNDLPHAFADAGRMHQIIHNLLFNALRHTPEGGIIVVEAETVGGDIAIAVSDTGIGIPPDRLAHVFDRYYQVERVDRAEGGSGLGLHIVQQLVQAQGGRIEVESTVGRGTRFRFTVPRASGNRLGAAPPARRVAEQVV